MKKMKCSNGDCVVTAKYQEIPNPSTCPKCTSLWEHNGKWFDGEQWIDKEKY